MLQGGRSVGDLHSPTNKQIKLLFDVHSKAIAIPILQA
jgi:hypothetical protein